MNPLCFRCMSKLLSPGAPCPHCGALGSELHNQANQLPVGSILAGKYLVGCTLGQGGFGVTYIGWDLNLNSKLAIKEYYPEGFVSRDNTNQSTVLPFPGEKGLFFQNGRAKFVEEARILAQFSADPGIVSVHDFFNENGTAYIVMDFVEGKTLKQLAAERGGKLPAQEVLRYLLPVMDSLARIHASGLLHRDISPDNIIIRSSDDRAVLLDFGAARQISAMGEHSNTINVKHGFAPEEQYRTRGEQGPWTDIYALCATIYRLTTGVTPMQAIDRVIADTPLTPPNALGADFTPAQQAAIMQGLSIHGRDRRQSVQELRTQLYALTPMPTPTPTPPVKPKKRTPLLIAVAVAVCLLIVPIAVAGIETAVTKFPTATPYSLTFEEFGKQFAYADVGNYGVRITAYLGVDAKEEVIIPTYVEDKMVVAIGYDAFADNDAITTVKLPPSVTRIDPGAFEGCTLLTSVEMPGVTIIDFDAFKRCGSLTSVDMPFVTDIKTSAFEGCTSLTSVDMPSVTIIGIEAFRDCNLLTSVDMPSVTSIGDDAFKYCDALTIHCLSGSYVETYAKKNSIPYTRERQFKFFATK